ncbi:hypothetical protein JG687_00002271, partial [Phytophthora cactorum]
MDEDEDTYGFGSFADLFDVGPARVAKRLDVGALSRFCMSERLLSRFEQQQRRDKRVVLYQHVAAKFDGVRIDGGLGALGVAPLEGGGIVWLQTTQSDSDALERRKKELQDITNRQNNGEHKSAAALFVAFKHVAAVQPTTVQNTVQSVEIKLVDGNRLDLTFMPGPFAGPKHRDEFLETLKKQMSGGSKDMQETVKTAAVHTSVRRSGATSEAKRKTVNSKSKEKEKFRQLVRRYTRLDPMSEEALAVAKQVYAGTGYYLGPTTKHTPKFTEDAEYRKKTVAKLSDCLKRMNQEWSEADAHRELHTKAKHSRNEDDLLEYTDTVTGAQIPTRTYEQRYLEYVKAHEVNPVLHIALQLCIEGDSQMIEQRVAGHSRGKRRQMLQQWKKHNDAKREVKARLQEDERMEEEEFFLSLSKALPVGQVQAAALRNYQAAGKLRWKRLMFQSLAEQQQLDEEMTE